MSRGDSRGTTPHRTFRCPDDPWLLAKAKATAEGRTLSEVLRDLLDQYVSEPVKKEKTK